VKTKSVDNIQLYMAMDITIHPSSYKLYLEAIKDITFRHKLCLLPQATFELFEIKIEQYEQRQKLKKSRVG
jgi:hypothetical protein